MAREKVTVTLDRRKLSAARTLIQGKSNSATLDEALDRLIRAERLRHDVAAYRRTPLRADELGVAELPVELDLDDQDVDYDALYGGRK
jgi:hypothetical protein